MRNFIISLISITIITGSWLAFNSFSAASSHRCQDQSDTVIELIAAGRWEDARNGCLLLQEQWNSYKKAAHIFLDSKDISEIDCTLKKSLLYIEAEDASNSSGEIAYAKDKFKLLHANDSVTWNTLL